MTSTDEIGKAVTAEAVTCLRYGVEKIEHCLGQLDDDQIWWRPNEEMNAIGNLLLHLAGNLGQWIVAGIGDTEYKRDRPAEFSERRKRSKDEVLKTLLDAVEKSCATLTAMSDDEFLAMNRIQGSDVSNMNAMMHAVTHFQGHVQEIIGLTRQTLGTEYRLQWTPQTAEEGAP